MISYNKWTWAESSPLFPVLFHFPCGCMTVSQMHGSILVLLCSVAFEEFLLPNHLFFLNLSGKVHWDPSSKLLKAITQYCNKKLTHWSWLAWERCFFAFWENIKHHLCCQKLAKYVSMLPWGEKLHRVYVGCSFSSLDLILHFTEHSWSISDLFKIIFYYLSKK